MANLFRPRASFLQNTAWQNQAKNALHYNTSQQGSVIPLIYGTMRQQVNLIDLNNYRGPKGKKGKTGSLPLQGTSQTGKGSGGGKGKGSKKNGHYTVDADFGICQGPVSFNASNQAYSSSGVESFSATGLLFYSGEDGQGPDGHFNQIGYSGTCHITGVPIDLGQSPVLPNLGFEITGMMAGLNTGDYSRDANPAYVVVDMLINQRYGAGFPSDCLSNDILHDDSGTIRNTYSDYCQAARLVVSVTMDGHQKAIEWLDGIMKLTNSTMVWSGRFLKIIPYGDLILVDNGAAWEPINVEIMQYDVNDDHYIPWRPHQEGGAPSPGEDDPITMTRSNPADADNWISIEYLDRSNFYNSTIITAYDQGAIDTYGLRIGDSVPGKAFANVDSAQRSIQLILQRRLYIRNSQIRFQLGWQFCLLEPMDMITISGRAGDIYLNKQPVRILSIEENDNGELTFTCEDIQTGYAAPPMVSAPTESAFWAYGTEPTQVGTNEAGVEKDSPMMGGAMVLPFTNPRDPVYDWGYHHPPDSTEGTFSMWININKDTAPREGDKFGLIRTSTANSLYLEEQGLPPGSEDFQELMIYINDNRALCVILGGNLLFQSQDNTIPVMGVWNHILVTWNFVNKVHPARFWMDGSEMTNTVDVTPDIIPDLVRYSREGTFFIQTLGFDGRCFAGNSNHIWWNPVKAVGNPSTFRRMNNTPKDLGDRGEVPTGEPPYMFLDYRSDGQPHASPAFNPLAPPEDNYWYGLNRAAEDPTSGRGDPEHPNLVLVGDQPVPGTTPLYR